MRCFIGFGANIGKPLEGLTRAAHMLTQVQNVTLKKFSPLYKTEPIGPAQPDFYNGVAVIETTLPAPQLLKAFLSIEESMGRVRKKRWGPRVIDIDLLTYGNQRIRTAKLSVPHPRYHLRRFVLAPLCDVAARAVHPRLRLTHKTLLSKLTPLGQRVTIAASWNGKQFSPFKPKKIKSNPSSR